MRLEAFDGGKLLWTVDPAEVDSVSTDQDTWMVFGRRIEAQPQPLVMSFAPGYPGRSLFLQDHGADVQTWQDRLCHLGYPVLTDGSFSAATADATRLFQMASSLSPTGRVDEATWAAAFHPRQV